MRQGMTNTDELESEYQNRIIHVCRGGDEPRRPKLAAETSQPGQYGAPKGGPYCGARPRNTPPHLL